MGKKIAARAKAAPAWTVIRSSVVLAELVYDEAWNVRGLGRHGGTVAGDIARARTWLEQHRDAAEVSGWEIVEADHGWELPQELLELRDAIRQTLAGEGRGSALAPITVVQRRDESMFLVAGYRRVAATWLAVRGAGATVLSCDVVPEGRERDANMLENLHREDLSPPQKANAIYAEMAEKRDTCVAVAKRWGIGEQYARNLVRCRRMLAAEVWEQWLQQPARWSRNTLELVLELPKGDQLAALLALDAPKARAPRAPEAPAEVARFAVPLARLDALGEQLEALQSGKPVKGAEAWTAEERAAFVAGANWARVAFERGPSGYNGGAS